MRTILSSLKRNALSSIIFVVLLNSMNFLSAQNPTVISDSLIVMNRVYAKEKLIVDQEAKFKQDIKVLGNARIHTDLKVDGELRVDGTTKLNGNVKMTSLATIDSLFAGTELLYILPNGQLNKGPLDELIYQVYKEGACFDGADILNPTWSNGLNKIFSTCPQVKVGIGNSSPLYSLDVRGTSYSRNVLVGSSDGTVAALINGFIENSSQDLLQLGKKLSTSSQEVQFRIQNAGSIQTVNSGSSPSLMMYNGTGHAVVIYGNGGSKILQIEDDGLLRTREVRIDAGTWADYVFDKNYQLPKLKDVAKYIDKNHHLPGIPSSQEIKTNGINVGEMQTLQMQKIEELTLYMIEMDKKMDAMQTEIDDLKEENKKLKK